MAVTLLVMYNIKTTPVCPGPVNGLSSLFNVYQNITCLVTLQQRIQPHIFKSLPAALITGFALSEFAKLGPRKLGCVFNYGCVIQCSIYSSREGVIGQVQRHP